jgi:hypothetical protein
MNLLCRLFLCAALAAAPAQAQLMSSGFGQGDAGGAAVTGMSTPLFLSAGLSTPSNSATNYSGFVIGSGVGGTIPTATTGIMEAPMPTAGTFSNLTIGYQTTITQGSLAITMTKNGSATSLTCTVQSGTQTCTDATHTVSVVAGDTVGYTYVPTGTPTASANSLPLSVLFTSTAANEGILLTSGNPTSGASNSVTNYFNVVGQPSFTATENLSSFVLPVAGTIDQVYMVSNNAAGTGGSFVYTLEKNGADTTVTCTLSGNSALTCNDTTHSATFAAGDTVSLKSVPSGSPNASARIRFGMRWKPTTTGQALVMGSANGVATSGTGNTPMNGWSSVSGTEQNRQDIVPIANITFKQLYALVSTVPGGSTTRTLTLRKGATPGNAQSSSTLTCTIASAATSCQDTSDSYASTLENFVNLQTTTSGTNAAVTYFKYSMVACYNGAC